MPGSPCSQVSETELVAGSLPADALQPGSVEGLGTWGAESES